MLEFDPRLRKKVDNELSGRSPLLRTTTRLYRRSVQTEAQDAAPPYFGRKSLNEIRKCCRHGPALGMTCRLPPENRGSGQRSTTILKDT